MQRFGIGVIAGGVCFVVAGFLAYALFERIFVTCVPVNPCPGGLPQGVGACIGIAAICKTSATVLPLALVIGAPVGVASGLIAYRRSVRRA